MRTAKLFGPTWRKYYEISDTSLVLHPTIISHRLKLLMNTRFTKSLLLVALFLIFGGLVYYGLKIADANKLIVNPIPTSSSVPSQANLATPEEINAAGACQTPSECTVISRPSVSGDKKTTTIDCLNKSYLSTCVGCTSTQEVIDQVAQEASCACVANQCQFDRK